MLSSLFGRLFRSSTRRGGSAEARRLPFTEARRLAEAQAESYTVKHRLTAHEAAVLHSAMINSAILSRDDRRWLSVGLEELERFRSISKKRGIPTDQQVDVLPEEAWSEEWRNEARLTVLFSPEVGRWAERRELKPPVGSPGSRLFSGDWLCEAAPETQDVRLYGTEFWPHKDPFLWKGSRITIAESTGALELRGGAFSSHTPITATGSLAAPSFDFVSGLLTRESASCAEDESLWLAIGFPLEGASIPRPRPVQPEDVIEDPVRLEHQARRLCFHLGRVPAVEARSRPAGRTIGRWMAVERE